MLQPAEPDLRDRRDEPPEPPPPPAYPYVFVPFDDTDWGARPLPGDWASPRITAVGNVLRVPLRNAGRGAALATYVFAYGLDGADRGAAVVLATAAAPVVPACADAAVVIELPDPLPVPADCIQLAVYDATGAPPVPPLDARADRRVGQYRYPFDGRWHGTMPAGLADPPGAPESVLPRHVQLAITAPDTCSGPIFALGGTLDGRRLFRNRLGIDAGVSGRSLDAEYGGRISVGPVTVEFTQHWRLALTPDGRLDVHLVEVRTPDPLATGPHAWPKRAPRWRERVEVAFTLTRP